MDSITINDKVFKVADLSAVKACSIILPKDKKVLVTPRPEFIPEIDMDDFIYSGCVFDCFKLAENRYLVALNGYCRQDTKGRYGSRGYEMVPHSNNFAVMSLDLLAATEKYYRCYAKAKFAEDQKDRKRKRRIKIMADNKADYGQIYFWEDMSGNHFSRYAKCDFWECNKEIRADIKQKVIDLELQAIEIENSYSKGLETSYGDSNLNYSLLAEFGVLVKRQNGDQISEAEILEIKRGLDNSFKTLGLSAAVLKNFGLKISHSGSKRMFANKHAIGIFYKRFNAIGVCFNSQNMGESILAHELAHLVDHLAGKMFNYNYASDIQGGDAAEIARIFRKNMNVAQTTDYQNRTCECFARALQQYFDYCNGYPLDLDTNGNHVAKDLFQSKLAPKIEKFLTDFAAAQPVQEVVVMPEVATAASLPETKKQPTFNKIIQPDLFDGIEF